MLKGIQKPLLGKQINWSNPLAKGLVGCWVMNEGSGLFVNDYSGNGIHFTMQGTTLPAWSDNGIKIYGASNNAAIGYIPASLVNSTKTNQSFRSKNKNS